MRWLAYMISRFLAHLLFSPFVKLHISGAEFTARRGAYVLVANHISHFDPPLITIAARRKLDWMAMLELFKNPLVGAWLRGIDGFPVNRSRVDFSAARTALKRLHLGHVVGIFPEGGIRDGERSVLGGAPMRPGIAAIVQLSGAPLIPCVILGSDRLYARRAWRPLRQTPVWIGFGEPISCTRSDDRDAFECALGEALRSVLSRMQKEFALTEDDLPQPPARRQSRA